MVLSCYIPTCSNDEISSPEKLFLRIPEPRKKEWCDMVGAECLYTTYMYCCEDHLKLEEDLLNYIKWKKTPCEPLLKINALPRFKITVVPVIKEEIMPEIKEEVVLEIKGEIVPETKGEMVPEIKEEIVPEIKEEIVPEIKEEIDEICDSIPMVPEKKDPLKVKRSRKGKFIVRCFIPSCPNNERTHPHKLYVKLRESKKRQWCEMVGANYCHSLNMYCCEDHLEPEEDLHDYDIWKAMDCEPLLEKSDKLRLNKPIKDNGVSLRKKESILRRECLSSPKTDDTVPLRGIPEKSVNMTKLPRHNSTTCFIPSCSNNATTNPDKLFIKLRQSYKKVWCEMVGAKYCYSLDMYCCEDHLKLEEDLQNYTEWKVMDCEPRLKTSAKPRLNKPKEEGGIYSSIMKAPNLCLELLRSSKTDPVPLRRRPQESFGGKNSPPHDSLTCFIPGCSNTGMADPDKLFIKIRDTNKKAWCKMVGAKCSKTAMYSCEDHFKLEEDLENYNKWKLMGCKPVFRMTAKPRLNRRIEKHKKREPSLNSLMKKAPNLCMLLLGGPKSEDPLEVEINHEEHQESETPQISCVTIPDYGDCSSEP